MARKKYYDNTEIKETEKNKISGKCIAGLYIRISREDEDKTESDSVANQRGLLTNYAKEKPDMIIGDIFIDDGYTGTNFNRPGFKRMISAIKSGEINCVIVKDLSRFGRDYIQAGNYLEQLFPFLNCRFISVLDNLDSFERPEEMNGIFVRFKHIMNDYYSSEISRKVRSAFDQQRKEGKLVSAFAPYGYKKDPDDCHHLIIDEEVSYVVKNVFDWFLSGMGVIRIAQKLNDLKILPPGLYRKEKGIHKSLHRNCGALWRPNTVRFILSNKVYIGTLEQKKKSTIDYKNRKDIKVDYENRIITEDTHVAIIEKNVFSETQRIMSRCKRTAPKKKKVYLFSGFIKCADCKRAMIRTSKVVKGKGYTYYKCRTYNQVSKEKCPQSHSIRHETLEEIVKKAIRAQIYAVINMKEVIKKVKESYEPKDVVNFKKEVKNRQIRIKEKNNLKIGLYEDYKAEIISKDEYMALKEKYETEIEELEESIFVLKKEENEAYNLEKSGFEWMTNFVNYNNSIELSRELLTALVDVIYITSDKNIQIHFRYQDEYQRTSKMISDRIQMVTAND